MNPEPHDKEQLLRQIPLYRRLKPEDRQRLAAVTVPKSYAAGETIFHEGAPCEHFYMIARGRVKVFKVKPSGRDVILEIFEGGDPLGAVAVYEERPFPASAEAMEETLCLLTPRREFFALLEQHPTLTRGLLAALNLRLVQLTSRLADLTGGRVEPRFARLFLKLAEQIGQPSGREIAVPMALSRQELADLTGTTIETCIRIMSRWGKENVVRTEEDGFVIADRDALDELALS